jgi:hypothetical protein
MPCDSIITQSVDLGKCGDMALLTQALESVGAYVRGVLRTDEGVFTFADGKISGDIRYAGIVADRIKRAYAKGSVIAAAKKQGFMVRELSANKLQVIRRY